MRPSYSLEKNSLRHILKISAIMYESSSLQLSKKPPLECNQDQTPLMNQGLL